MAILLGSQQGTRPHASQRVAAGQKEVKVVML